jgi:hypothetical protein
MEATGLRLETTAAQRGRPGDGASCDLQHGCDMKQLAAVSAVDTTSDCGSRSSRKRQRAVGFEIRQADVLQAQQALGQEGGADAAASSRAPVRRQAARPLRSRGRVRGGLAPAQASTVTGHSLRSGLHGVPRGRDAEEERPVASSQVRKPQKRRRWSRRARRAAPAERFGGQGGVESPSTAHSRREQPRRRRTDCAYSTSGSRRAVAG